MKLTIAYKKKRVSVSRIIGDLYSYFLLFCSIGKWLLWGYPSVTLNIFNDWYARDCSKKIRAVFKAKGQSGKHLCPPVYGYKKSDTDKNLWVIDDTAAEVVRKIFRLCIDGYSPVQIARILTEQNIPTPTAYALSQGHDNGRHNAKLYRWGAQTISHILERLV